MKLISGIVLVASMFVSLVGQTTSPPPSIPVWTPPAERKQALTLFAPKPITGDNIFKGEAESWLAEAIVDLEVGTLTPIKNKEVSEYISMVGQNLVKYSTRPNKHFEFVVVDSAEENAFSIGGGRIYIDLGMLKAIETEDELAAVIAHEIGHDCFMHAPKTVTRQMFWMTGKRKVTSKEDAVKALRELNDAYEKHTLALIGENLLGWSRFAELEADKAGFYNMYKAGYNPEAMKTVFRRFVAQEKLDAGENYNSEYLLTLLFGSHPPSSQRVTALKWESNWIKIPPKESVYKNPSFDAMKAIVKTL